MSTYAKLRTEKKKEGNFENEMLFGRVTSDPGLSRVGLKYHGPLRTWPSFFFLWFRFLLTDGPLNETHSKALFSSPQFFF